MIHEQTEVDDSYHNASETSGRRVAGERAPRGPDDPTRTPDFEAMVTNDYQYSDKVESALNEIQENWKKFDLKEAIYKVGSDGRYQRLIYINAVLVLFSASFTIYSISYILAEPIPHCIQDAHQLLTKPEYSVCPEQRSCALIAKTENPKYPLGYLEWTYPSWTEMFGYYCEKESLRATSKSLIIMFATLICLVLLYLTDILGRRKVIMISSTLIISGVLLTSGAFWIFVGDSILIRMLGVTIAGGAEGAFTVLFNMVINETSLPESKIRSQVIAGSFVAYGVGCVAINILTIWVRDSNTLVTIAAFLVIATTVPSYFSFFETPEYLYSSGKYTELVDCLTRIGRYNDKHVSKKDFLKMVLMENYTEEVERLDIVVRKMSCRRKPVIQRRKIGPDGKLVGNKELKKNSKSTIKILKSISERRVAFKIAAISTSIWLAYSLFYGMLTSIQELGLDNTNLNGTLLGIMQTVGYLSTLPYLHMMKRKKWSLRLQFGILAGAGLLLLLSFINQGEKVNFFNFLETSVSTCLIGPFVSAWFPILFIYSSELFRVEIRGVATAVALSIGKVGSSMAPFMCKFSQDCGLHVLVGCSLPALISLPLTYYVLTETLGVEGDKHGFGEYGASELKADMSAYYMDAPEVEE